jgi:ABC-type phosphate/phosphonate transport system substrate-binding protein
MRAVLTTLAALVLCGASACAADRAAGNAETAWAQAPDATPPLNAEAKPLRLKIAVNDIYCQKTACECISSIATRSYDTLVKELKTRHHITLEMSYFMEVFDLQKAIQANSYDGALCKPWTVLQYSNKSPARFKRVADLRDPDNQALMTGVFLTLAGSPVSKLAELQGKRIALGQEDSYEKHQAPLQMLAAANVKPAQQLLFSSCSENLSALLDGEVEVAVVSSYALTASCAVDFTKPEDFKTLAQTPPMPLTSLLVDLNKVAAADVARLQAALLEVSGEHAPADLSGKGFVLPASWQPTPPAVANDGGKTSGKARAKTAQ